MEFPELDELEWLEANIVQEEENDYPLDQLEVEEGRGGDDTTNEYANNHFSPIAFKKRPRSRLDSDKEDAERVRVRAARPITNTQTVQDDDDWLRLTSNNNNNNKDDDDGNDTTATTTTTNNNSYTNSRCLSRYASEIEGDCVPVTAPSGSGERVYAKIDKQIFTVRDGSGHGQFSNLKMPVASSTGLISQPVSMLLQKAEQDALMQALEANSEVQNSLLLPETSVVTEELWVNKYAPKSFTELLSDEQTNREVLFWLKQWDGAVFGTDIRNTAEEVLSALRRHSSLPHHQKHSETSFLRKHRGPTLTGNYIGCSAILGQENTRAKDTQGLHTKKLNGLRTPDQKILLLCGPPGLGKTTLAHVAAKHCGYHVVEINASDDRSSTTVEAKILDAVQMNSVMVDSKPKCLVIDEIDGALGEGKGAVEVILKMVAAERKSDAGKEVMATEDRFGRKSSKKGCKVVSLSRPVICICNDLYAPSLRPLRHIAKVHVFAQPTVNRVVSRLKYICNKEGVKTSSLALTALAEHTECDIRSCLNTLQFLHKKNQSLNLVALSSQVIGRKDMTRSVFHIWKEVFQKRKKKQSPKFDVSQVKTYDADDSLYSLTSSRGDYELVVDGIYENLLQMHYHDPMLLKTVGCLDALGVSDLLHQCIVRSHIMSLCAYHPPIIVTIHRLLAHVERPTLQWPKSIQRYRTLLTEKMEILRSWQSTIAPWSSRHLSVDSFVEDAVSPLLRILSPADLRPVALHLLSEKEKNDLAQLVSTMVSYSLTYKCLKSNPSTNDSGRCGTTDASSLSLDPPIQDFVSFKDYKPGYHELKSAVKQVLVHEVEKQKIVKESTAKVMHFPESSRRENNAANDKRIGMPECSKSHEAASVDLARERTKYMSRKPNACKSSSSLDTVGSSADVMNLKSAGARKKPSVDSFNFFDRFKKLSHKGLQHVDSPAVKPATTEKDGHPLLFKFNEGFTNAVKRPMRIREFLL